MYKKLLKSAVFSSVLLSSSAMAEVVYQGTTIGGQVGIFGIGAHLKGKFTEDVNIRASFDKFKKSDIKVEGDDADFNFDLSLQDILLVGEYHPWKSSFAVNAGLIINSSELDGVIVPKNTGSDEISFTFNNKDYTYKTAELGAINTTAKFDPVAPYVGMSWDTSFTKKEGFGFTFDLGIAYQGSVKTSYKLNYGAALDIEQETAGIPDGPLKDAKIKEIEDKKREIEGELKDKIDKEMISVQDELDKYQFMPYIAIGINYKF